MSDEPRSARLHINLRPSMMDAIRDHASARGQTVTTWVERACQAQLDQMEMALERREAG